MRRKDREMDRAFALEIIDEAAFGVLSLMGEGEPYSLPLSLVRDGQRLCFHTAREGHKYEFIREGAVVHVVFVSRVKVPKLYSEAELDRIAETKEGLPVLISQVFTTEFASAMVKGTIRELTDPEDKKRVLQLICQKYTPDKLKYFEVAHQSGAALTRTFAISMDEVTGKRKRFDAQRQEMKFGRME